MRMPTSKATGKWLFFSFAAGLLACFLVIMRDALGLLYILVYWPWYAGPAALAASLAVKSESGWTSWAFVAVEIAVVSSTAVLWFNMFMYPDPATGMVMVFLPALQFAGVFVAAFMIKGASAT